MIAKSSTANRALMLAVIVLAIIWTAFPVYYLILTSVKPAKELLEVPPKFVTRPHFETYDRVLIQQRFYRFFVNSFVIAAGATALALVLGALGTFAFTQWRFKGREPLFVSSLIGRMFPPVTTLIPIYLIVKFMRLLDSPLALILIYASFLLPLVLLILRDFFQNVPAEICECARLDGISNLGLFVKIILPLSINGILATAVLCFVEAWNEFLFALVLTSFRAKTASVVLGTYVENEGMLQWGVLAALGVCTILPTVLFMVFMQKFLIKGLTLGSLKA